MSLAVARAVLQRSLRGLPLAPLLLLLAAPSGCTLPVEPSDRVVTSLGDDGYALFRVDAKGADEVAVLVEMRGAPPGTYALLYSEHEPDSIGWFALDLGAIRPCRRYGAGAVEEPELDCLVADGRGELVDLVSLGDSMVLLPSPSSPRASQPTSSAPKTTLMRHEMCGCEGCRCCVDVASSKPRSASRAGYYAVLRIEGGEPEPVPVAVEARPFGDGAREPTVIQID